MKKMKEKNGITLVALIVTIVILLILAGISILTLTNQGLFGNAKQAESKSKMAEARELIVFTLNEWHMDNASKGTAIDNFFNQKVVDNEIDAFEAGDDEGTYNIYKNGYVLTVDLKGNIVEEIQKSGPRPKTENVKITTTDGTTVVADNSVKGGTKLTINFDSSIEGGTIKSITPAVPYTTNGTEIEVKFTVVGTVNGTEYKKNFKVNLEKKYKQYGRIVDEVNKGTIKIGDYVSYTPDTISNTDEKYTTLISNFNTYSGKKNKPTQSKLNWRVLDVKDGQVRLISEEPSTFGVTLYGAIGYNNAVKLIDDTCRILYNNSKLASKVQNLKIEDIQEHLTYDYTQYTNPNVDTGKYGGTITMSGKEYPNIFQKEKTGWVNGIQGKEFDLSEQTDFFDETYTRAESIKLTQTYWCKYLKEEDFENPIYYKLFIWKGSDYYIRYFLSSRCVNVYNIYQPFWGVYYIKNGGPEIAYTFLAGGGQHTVDGCIRPCITLKSDVKIDGANSGDGSKVEQAYAIK